MPNDWVEEVVNVGLRALTKVSLEGAAEVIESLSFSAPLSTGKLAANYYLTPNPGRARFREYGLNHRIVDTGPAVLRRRDWVTPVDSAVSGEAHRAVRKMSANRARANIPGLLAQLVPERGFGQVTFVIENPTPYRPFHNWVLGGYELAEFYSSVKTSLAKYRVQRAVDKALQSYLSRKGIVL